MYTERPNFPSPQDETVIWRYTSLDKMLGMLCDNSLFMCRLDKLEDPWEGEWPESIRHESPGLWNWFAKDGYTKKSFFVNCWHISQHESAALWALYAGKAGLAIKSTCGSMKRALSSDERVYISKVTYHDYALESLPASNGIIQTAFMKRKSFEHEHELRVLAADYKSFETLKKDGKRLGHLNPSEAPDFIKLPVHLPTLLEAVYVSPGPFAWLQECIEELLCKFGLGEIPVHHSNLYDERVW